MHTSPIEKVILALLVLTALGFFLYPVIQRIRIIWMGRGSLPFDRIGERIVRWFREVFFQGTVIAGRPGPGLAHALVFWTFLVFMIETADAFIRALTGFEFGLLGNGPFHDYYRILVGCWAILCVFGISTLLIRRFIVRPQALGAKLSYSSGAIALLILASVVTYILGIFALEEGSFAFEVNGWIHIFVIATFLILLPRSKHLHLVFSIFTVFFKDFELAAIKPLNIDFEDESIDEEDMYLGAEKYTDLGKFMILASFTCVECGRCFDNCPARITGKKLDPKELILSLKKIYSDDPEKKVVGDPIFQEQIWQCTTCGACAFQCPLGIDQPIAIIEMRRGYVANSIFPDAMRPLFDNMESTGNPWNYQQADAAEFLSENKFPEYEKGKILWWMGCMARYNDQYQKVALAFKKLLDSAGVDYGVLMDEQCTGDAARRAGNEFLFQTMAEMNIEILNEKNPGKIVTTCPHCLRTLKEYKEMGLNPDIEMVNHSHFLMELINSGKLKLNGKVSKDVVFHDACLLSRYGGDEDYLNPRSLIKKAGVTIHEPERTKRKSFCCGAGGGMLFTEETEGTRINHERVDELMKSGADEVCVACPFCQMMIMDGYGDKGVEDAKVRDVAEILAEGL